jgi:AraC family transcriptional regulator
MNVVIEDRPAIRVATVRHTGPYPKIGEAFERLGAIAGPAGLLQRPATAMVAIYHDDPESTPAAELRSDAGVTVPSGVSLPPGLDEMWLPAGRYARTTHIGPYTELPAAWSRLLGRWLPVSGEELGPSASYELYRNDPSTAPPQDLRTELYAPLR